MNSTQGTISNVKTREDGKGFVIYIECSVGDELGESTKHKFLKGYSSLKNPDSLKGKKVEFDADDVSKQEYELPEGHEAAGTVINRYWLNQTNAVKLV